MAFAEMNCALGIRRMYRLYAKPNPSVPTMLPTDTTTSGACGWMSLTRCTETSSHDLSFPGRGLEPVEEKKPMAKQHPLKPRPRPHGRLDEEIFSISPIPTTMTYSGCPARRRWQVFLVYSLISSSFDRQSLFADDGHELVKRPMEHYCLSGSRAEDI